jgi:glycosyltransferase involved in cell wall biosynthesis
MPESSQNAPSDGPAPLRRGPLVSVVIPTYNRALRLPLALQSVVDARLDPVEIVVVDDGSTDNTGEVVERFGRGVRYIQQANAGPAAARNRGIREARGDYILFLDSDDRLLPNVHRPLVEFLDRHPEIGVVFTDAVVNMTDGRSERAFRRNNLNLFWRLPHTMIDGVRVFERQAFLRALVLDRCYIAINSIIRLSTLETAGLFDEHLFGYEEWDLFARLAAVQAMAYADEPGATIEKHAGNLSGDVEAMVVQGVAILDKFLDGAVPVAAADRPAVLSKLNGAMFGAAYFAFERGDHVTARARLAAHMKRWGVSGPSLAYWCATWLPPRFVERVRDGKARLSHRTLHASGPVAGRQ